MASSKSMALRCTPRRGAAQPRRGPAAPRTFHGHSTDSDVSSRVETGKVLQTRAIPRALRAPCARAQDSAFHTLRVKRAVFGEGGMRGVKQLAAAKKKSTPAPVAKRAKPRALLPSSDEDEAEEPGPSPSAGSGGDTQEEGAPVALCKPPSLWALKGALAGRAAADASRAQRPYSVDPPAAVTSAGEEAELEWLMAFEDKFKTGTAVVQAEDRLVSGLVKKKKHVRGATEPNKNGLAGLQQNAAPAVSVAVYAMVRDEFFLPDDHAQAAVRSHLTQEGFTFTDDDFTTWWEELGHAIVLHKFKSARHSLVDSVKQSVWRIHGARYALRLACPT